MGSLEVGHQRCYFEDHMSVARWSLVAGISLLIMALWGTLGILFGLKLTPEGDVDTSFLTNAGTKRAMVLNFAHGILGVFVFVWLVYGAYEAFKTTVLHDCGNFAWVRASCTYFFMIVCSS